MNLITRSLPLAGLLALTGAVSADEPKSIDTAERMSPSQLLSYERLNTTPRGGALVVDDLVIEGMGEVDLQLTEFTVRGPNTQIIEVGADGVERPLETGVRMFRGNVAGDADSRVFVAVSPFGTNGYIQDAKDLYSISSGPSAVLPGEQPGEVLITNAADIDWGEAVALSCGSDPVYERYADLAANIQPEPPQNTEVRAEVCRVADIAVETDYEYTNRVFGGNTTASAAYAETLMGAIDTIYSDDVDTNMRVSFLRVWASNNDPYNGNSGDPLDQVQNEWNLNMDHIHRETVHFLTGRTNTSYGGVAYLGSVCDGGQGYGVSAYINGSFPMPLQDNTGGNWDVVVVAHELGHNFGTGHTHDSYVPTIDDCGNGNCSVASNGTIMSYCHTCSGGISNIRLGFHARVKATVNFFLGSLYTRCDLTNPDWTPDALANDDNAEALSGVRTIIDFGENDTTGSCKGAFTTLGTFDGTSSAGGDVDTGIMPGTLDTGFFYTSPPGYSGIDTFTYTNQFGEPATVTVDVVPFRSPDSTGPLVFGAVAEYFDFDQPLSTMPSTVGLTPDATEVLSLIEILPTSGNFAGSGLSDTFAAVITGYIEAPVQAIHKFHVDSDDGSKLFIGGTLVVDHDGQHGYTEATGEIPLQPGVHNFRLEYFDNTGSAGLTLSYSIEGSVKLLVNASMLLHDGPPCPVDLNGDGILDNGDIAAFLSFFLAGDLITDFNGDGILDNGDIAAFLALFLAGC